MLRRKAGRWSGRSLPELASEVNLEEEEALVLEVEGSGEGG